VLKGTQKEINNYLIKQLPKAIAFFNTDFELVHVSDHWVADFEFGKRNILGNTIYELFDHVEAELEELLETCLLGKGGSVGTHCFVDGSGRERWFEWTNIPWYDDGENIAGVIIQSEDITQQVRDREKLEKLELLLKEKSEIAKIGSWEYDAINEKLYWCAMTKRIHGVADSYQPDLDSAIEFYREGYCRNTISMAIFKAMEQGITWSEKLQLIDAGGKEIWVIVAGKPLYKDGVLQGLLGTIQDITDLVKSEIKTRESEHLLRTVVDNLPLNVYIKDLESKKILANRWECEFLGVNDASELIGKTDFDFYDREMAQVFREEDLSVLNSLNPILGKESLNVKPDGSSTTFLTSKIPLMGTDGKAYGLLGISMDISHLKKQESELRDLINVTSLQNKKLINFAHIVSHNLRSHTANFSMLLDFLTSETDESEQKKIVEMLTMASDNLLETLANLNEVISINTNVGQEKKPVRLNDKITSVSNSLSPFLRHHNAKIINNVDANTHVKAIPAYLENILMNFITNAVKFRDPKRDPVITLDASATDDHTILSISDNGLGIDLKQHGEKLFGMYKTFHDNAEARGIGLYITKNQVEAMEGKITTTSKVGKGTTFNIHFNEKN
jgi:PAS domain S-box-containing protein